VTTPVISLPDAVTRAVQRAVLLARIRTGVAKLRRALVTTCKWLGAQVPEALLLGGAAAVTYGVGSMYRPAGWVVGGLLALAAGWRLGRG
jgi:hypothetical protein